MKYAKRFGKVTSGGGSGIDSGSMFPLQDIVASLDAGDSIGQYTDGENIPLSQAPTIQKLIEMLAIKTKNPTFIFPFASLSLSTNTTTEVGTVVSGFIAIVNFNRGSIIPDYTIRTIPPYVNGDRSGVANNYAFSGNIITPQPTSVSNVSVPQSITVINGANTVSAVVSYNEGAQPENSAGGDFDNPLLANTLASVSASFTGIHPYFFGKVSSGGAAGANRPTRRQALINSGTKVVASSSGTITVNFASTSDDYIWFAIPTTSTSKTKWFVDALNNGTIGGSVFVGGNLFPSFDFVTISSPTSLWSGVSYKIYVSNYQTTASTIELRNS